ncbi:MAG: deoxyribose-phosphate aldolase [Bacillaceae bacterium]|nr:deoxyribose-phosphate aldolase [Bacillaceae bacterium]
MARDPLAGMIDHTLLKPDATSDMIDQLVQEAKTHQFASVCVNPGWVRRCAEQLKGTDIKVCTVIGFPLGATTMEAKAFEAVQAIQNGADELDMVINIGRLKANDDDYVKRDIEAVTAAVQGKDITVKVILETAMLTEDEIQKACRISRDAGAHFVKTSTGFGPGGATVADVRLMKETVGDHMEVKASGGIRTRSDAEKMIEAGATRIGASASVAIVTGQS